MKDFVREEGRAGDTWPKPEPALLEAPRPSLLVRRSKVVHPSIPARDAVALRQRHRLLLGHRVIFFLPLQFEPFLVAFLSRVV